MPGSARKKQSKKKKVKRKNKKTKDTAAVATHRQQEQKPNEQEKRRSVAAGTGSAEFSRRFNFVNSSAPGCHVCHFESDWILETGPIVWADFGLSAPSTTALPDISVDPESHVLTVINAHTITRCFYITAFHKTLDRDRQPLEEGRVIDQNGAARRCTTFVLRLQPETFMDVCFLADLRVDPATGMPVVDLESDISEMGPSVIHDGGPDVPAGPAASRKSKHNAPLSDVSASSAGTKLYSWPFAPGSKPILCSQGCNGHFTHFYPATRYAIDLECPVGTPLLAIADGVVKEVRQQSKVSGIGVSNLYKWNSVTLQLADGALAEYVHILHDSVAVEVGEAVAEGQLICKSGAAGFCPTPHLHLQVHDSGVSDAPTVPFAFRSSLAGAPAFCPQAGELYTESGKVGDATSAGLTSAAATADCACDQRSMAGAANAAAQVK